MPPFPGLASWLGAQINSRGRTEYREGGTDAPQAALASICSQVPQLPHHSVAVDAGMATMEQGLTPTSGWLNPVRLAQ
jgi:hypothetical protein